MKKTHLVIPIALVTLFVLSVGTINAQGRETITAIVDRASLSTDDVLTLTVTVNADLLNPSNPQLPSLPGFDVVGSSSSSQISIINGALSTQLVHVYRLQPYQAGELVIDPISVTLGGQTFNTQPIRVQVSQGSGARSGAPSAPSAAKPAPAAEALQGQDLFVEAEVDHATPYLGQQVVYTFRLYQATDLFDPFEQPQYDPPAFKGFWSETQTDRTEYRVQAAGRVYRVTELRTILFPSVVGPVTINPARLTTQGSLFRRGVSLATNPVTLDVEPLPSGAPESFSGAVGQFALAAEVDGTEGRVNEPLTLYVTLSGQGNLNAMPDPDWPEMNGWRAFESQATIEAQIQDGRLVGRRVYERLLMPGVEGQFTIPPLKYTYFDPVTAEYKTLSTQPIPVSIAPGTGAAPSTLDLGIEKKTVEPVATDIRHLKPVPVNLSANGRPLTERGLYWLTWGFPLLGLAIFFVWQRRERHWQNNLRLVRSSQARKKARKAMAQAKKEKRDAYETSGLILTAYLADKLDQPVGGLTHQALADLLSERKIAPDLIERVVTFLVNSELGRFAPEGDHAQKADDLFKEMDRLISALEKAL